MGRAAVCRTRAANRLKLDRQLDLAIVVVPRPGRTTHRQGRPKVRAERARPIRPRARCLPAWRLMKSARGRGRVQAPVWRRARPSPAQPSPGPRSLRNVLLGIKFHTASPLPPSTPPPLRSQQLALCGFQGHFEGLVLWRCFHLLFPAGSETGFRGPRSRQFPPFALPRAPLLFSPCLPDSRSPRSPPRTAQATFTNSLAPHSRPKLFGYGGTYRSHAWLLHISGSLSGLPSPRSPARQAPPRARLSPISY